MIELNRLLKVISFRPGATAEFQRMLGWKLLRGSHEFPGPDGGTCINEAAIVAAGYGYRAVHSIDDCPASFSRPIAMFALCLNDLLEDGPRQELLIPFVARLDGTADTAKVEAARADMMLRRTAVDILAPALMRTGFDDLARQCRAMATPDELIGVARCVRSRTAPGVHLLLVAACELGGRRRAAIGLRSSVRGRALPGARDRRRRRGHCRRRCSRSPRLRHRQDFQASRRDPRRRPQDRKQGRCGRRAGGQGADGSRQTDVGQRRSQPQAGAGQRATLINTGRSTARGGRRQFLDHRDKPAGGLVLRDKAG